MGRWVDGKMGRCEDGKTGRREDGLCGGFGGLWWIVLVLADCGMRIENCGLIYNIRDCTLC